VDLVTDRLAKGSALLPLFEHLSNLTQDLSDSLLELNEGGAKPAREAYVLAKAMARTNPIVSIMLAPVIAFYAAIAKAAAATRKEKAANAKQATPAPAPAPAPAPPKA
jgi:hypothetical protein